jgi:hypothetical protein
MPLHEFFREGLACLESCSSGGHPDDLEAASLKFVGHAKCERRFAADKCQVDVVFSGEVGKVLGPVKTQFGYHLIEIMSRTA